MLTINGLLKYENYIGHSSNNSLVLSSWFFYKLRKKVWIINLFKTIQFLKLVLKLLHNLVTYSLPFWFVSLELSKEFIYKKYASECGEFSCTKVWVRGLLSNFKEIENSICKYMLKKHVKKKFDKMYLLSIWAYTRFSWPRGIFLSNVSLNSIICKEAGSIALPVVALVDTNVKSYLFNYPIPSNDDSIESLNYVLSIISKKILISKYKKVLIWYSQYKSRHYKLFKKFKDLNKKLKLKWGRGKSYKKSYFYKKYLKKNLHQIRKVLLKPFFYNIQKSKILFHIFFKNLFNNVYNFIKNCHLLIEDTQTFAVSEPHITKRFNVKSIYLKFCKKLKYLRKLKDKQFINTNYLFKRNTGKRINPIVLYRQTLYLKDLNYIRYTKQGKKDIYLLYYFISNFLRKSRIYYESFFINAPSKFFFFKAFHKYYKPWWSNVKQQQNENADPETRWYYWYGYRFKLDKVAQEYWDVKKKFNQRLRANLKKNEIINISDSAIVVDIERWLMYNKKIDWLKRVGRFWLKFWLFPTFNRFSVKQRDNYHWYKAHFFLKEDSTFLRHFNWKVANEPTPTTVFQFYNNWFTFIFNEEDIENQGEEFDMNSDTLEDILKKRNSVIKKKRNIKNNVKK